MFTRHEAMRVKAVAIGVAVASWIFPVSVALFAVSSLRPWALAGFALGAACLGIAVLLGWSLFCPWCCGRLFFVASMANSPSPSQLWRQFLPYDILGKDRMTCPHCHSRFALQSAKAAPIAQPTERT
jgi:hypothetical protein